MSICLAEAESGTQNEGEKNDERDKNRNMVSSLWRGCISGNPDRYPSKKNPNQRKGVRKNDERDDKTGCGEQTVVVQM